MDQKWLYKLDKFGSVCQLHVEVRRDSLRRQRTRAVVGLDLGFVRRIVFCRIVLRIDIMSDRKSVICHVCGIETKKFGDHLAAAHKLKDHKTEKVSHLYLYHYLIGFYSQCRLFAVVSRAVIVLI